MSFHGCRANTEQLRSLVSTPLVVRILSSQAESQEGMCFSALESPDLCTDAGSKPNKPIGDVYE